MVRRQAQSIEASAAVSSSYITIVFVMSRTLQKSLFLTHGHRIQGTYGDDLEDAQPIVPIAL